MKGKAINKINTNSKSKKLKIINAAQTIISRYGFGKTTMDDIAAAVEMKKSSLYYYYKNKEAIIEDVVIKEAETYLEELENELEKSEKAYDKILTFVNVNIKKFIEKLNHYNLSLSVYLEIEHLLKDMHKNLQEKEKIILEGIINEGIKNGELRKCNTAKITQAILQVLEAVKCKDFCVKSTVKKSESISKINKNFEYLLTVLLDGLIIAKVRKN